MDTPGITVHGAHMEDLYRLIFHNLARPRPSVGSNQELIEVLKSQGAFSDPAIEKVLQDIPRGLFVPKAEQENAYDDSPLRLSDLGFNISAPHMHAKCLDSLELSSGHRFLDVGSGCGFLTAAGSYLVGPTGESIGLEIRKDIIDFAESNIRKLNEENPKLSVQPSFLKTNVFLLDPDEQQFDRIHVGASCPKERIHDLLKLLKPSGILITPSGQDLLKIKKDEKGKITEENLASVRYGDLQIPTDAELITARLSLEKKRTLSIPDVPSTLWHDLHQLSHPFNDPATVKALYDNDLHSDCVIHSQGRNFFVHKAILAARSDLFRALINHKKLENGSATPEKQVNGNIRFDELNPARLAECLKYIYTDEIDVNDENVWDLLEVSNYLQLQPLKRACEVFLVKALVPENVIGVLEHADRAAASNLKRNCIDMIVDNFDELSKTPAMETLDKALLVEITGEACRLYRRAVAIVRERHPEPDPDSQVSPRAAATASASFATAFALGDDDEEERDGNDDQNDNEDEDAELV